MASAALVAVHKRSCTRLREANAEQIRLFTNLLDDALRYTPERGSVT
jgi:signal transduction histidine kinase